MNRFDRFLADDLVGVHYAVSIFIATTVLWIVVKEIGDANPIRAISSMVATSDPNAKVGLSTFRDRILNTLLGCFVGIAVAWAMAQVWPLPEARAKGAAGVDR